MENTGAAGPISTEGAQSANLKSSRRVTLIDTAVRHRLHFIVAIRELASGVSVQQVWADPGDESVSTFLLNLSRR
jgi:hypothetical protein